MPVRVVDRLEMIQVERMDGQHSALPIGNGYGLLQAVLKQRPVRQAGEGIEICQVLTSRFGVFAGRDVASDARDADDGPGLISNRRHANRYANLPALLRPPDCFERFDRLAAPDPLPDLSQKILMSG